LRPRCWPWLGVVLALLLRGVDGTSPIAEPGNASGTGRPRVREKKPYPIQGIAPRPQIGGLVSIPGNPLPPLPRESVENAISICQPLLEGLRLFGKSSALARGLGYLASLYAAVGDAPRAEQLYDEAQSILERQGATGRDLGWVHNNRGLSQLEQRRYAAAAGSFRAAIDALGSSGERELLEPRAITLQNLASAEELLGDVEASESAYLKALDLLRRLGREQSRAYQTTSQNLAGVYVSIGDFQEARRSLEDLLALGGIRDRSLRFAILNDLGLVLGDLKDFPAAEARLQEARALAAAGSREEALVLTNLAVTHRQAGDLEKARREGESALRLAQSLDGTESVSAAAVEATLGATALARGDLLGAERLLTHSESLLSRPSEAHLQVLAEVNRALAIVAQRRGQHQGALALSRRALDLEVRSLDQILAFGSEAQRLAFQSNAFLYDHLANLGDATLLAEAVLRTKGAVLDSLLVERALVRKSTNPADREGLDRVRALKVALMEAVARGTLRGDAERDDLERSLKEEETALAKRLARSSRRERPDADLARVQAALESDQILVELVRFQSYGEGGKLTPEYGALVISGHRSPIWVVLCKADDLEPAIEKLVQQMDRGGRGAARLEPSQGSVTDALRGLYERLWKPLTASFPQGTRSVVLSPDGALHFVPWAALLDDHGTFVAERWQISQIDCGRDLLPGASQTPDKTLLALADGMGDLPYSKYEVQTVARIAAARGWRTEAFIGDAASKGELFKRRDLGILHLATHSGQFSSDSLPATRLSRQPMYRGYLLLGGAKGTLAAWQRGVTRPFSEDGILTAEEAAGLDLGRTWLTVLSACDTGAGEVRSGEGILGLRRAFFLAGTRYLLFTLWSVDDEAMSRFMELFYEDLFRIGDPTLAFQSAQLAELRRLRDGTNRSLTGAAYAAGGLVLTR